MHQKKWIVTGLFAFLATIALIVLTSSSSTDNLAAPAENSTCCKTEIKACKIQNNDQEIIHESLSRQFL